MERVAFAGIPSWLFDLNDCICAFERSLYFRAERPASRDAVRRFSMSKRETTAFPCMRWFAAIRSYSAGMEQLMSG
jgi:hypothetical protein